MRSETGINRIISFLLYTIFIVVPIGLALDLLVFPIVENIVLELSILFLYIFSIFLGISKIRKEHMEPVFKRAFIYSVVVFVFFYMSYYR